MIRVAILGATGYTALELIKILLRHPQVKITAITSRSEGGKPIAAVHPQLTNRLGLAFEDLSATEVAARADCVFSCLPHGVTAAVMPELIATGTRIVDFSADYRLNDAATFHKWYGEEHPDADRLGKIVYGLPEFFRDRIRDAQLVANPGCYPTSCILALAPLLKAGLIEPTDIICDSKSGVSGAGRSPKLNTHFPECNESIAAYNVGKHRHTPEIQQIIGRVVGSDPKVIFTPHLVPMDRGILTTAYSRPKKKLTEADVFQAWRDCYADEPFVRLVEQLPGTKETAHTNYCDLTARIVGDRLVTVSVLDNLIKGASGAAVQNMNVMFGFPETTAL